MLVRTFSAYNLKTGTVNAISILALTNFGRISKGAELAVTIYDTAKGFCDGISRTTEVSTDAVQYSYSHATTVMFKYVKPKGQSDDYQKLTYIATKGITKVGYQYSTFEYPGGSVEPGIIQGQYTLESIPDGYDDNAKAVNIYCNSLNVLKLYVDTIQIKGIENRKVCNLSTATPSGPWNIR